MPGAHPAAIAAASDGSVLINVVGLLPLALLERLTEVLDSKSLFLGVPLVEDDAEMVVARLDNAAAEASAHLLGGRSIASGRSKAKRR